MYLFKSSFDVSRIMEIEDSKKSEQSLSRIENPKHSYTSTSTVSIGARHL